MQMSLDPVAERNDEGMYAGTAQRGHPFQKDREWGGGKTKRPAARRSGPGSLALLVMAALLVASTATRGQTNVDLNTWSQKGPSGNGNWDVQGGGDSVFQSINGQPTYFVSPNDFFNTTVEGRFSVDAGAGDDDYIGFVFGYNEPGQNATDATFNLLDWKRGNQSSSEEGFRLARVNGTDTPPFTNAENDALPDYDVLSINTTASNPGSVEGWDHGDAYDFTLLYTPDRIKVDIEGGNDMFQSGVTVFDVSPTDVGLAQDFQSGRFGFYNHSQRDVRYESFTLTEPVLNTTPDDGDPLEFLARVGDSDDETITVRNDGGGGTMLTGTANGPTAAPFSGPAEPSGFDLGSGADDDFTYTYAPDTRTDGTPDTDSVDVVSNEDGTHSIPFQGTAVGPVADFSLLPGSLLDYGQIPQNETKTLSIDVSNVTTDGDQDALTDLILNNFEINGADAAKFSVIDFVSGEEVPAGQTTTVDLRFNPGGMLGVFDDATLSLLTDQGAPLGGDGADFTFNLSGSTSEIPEPTMLSLLTLGGAVLLGRRRDRSA